MIGSPDAPAFQRNNDNNEVIRFNIGKSANKLLNQKIN